MDMVVSFPGGKKVDAIYKGFTIKTDQSGHALDIMCSRSVRKEAFQPIISMLS